MTAPNGEDPNGHETTPSPLEVRSPARDGEFRAALGVLGQLRTDVPVEEMPDRIEAMARLTGYRLLVGVDPRGEVVAVAGVRPDDGLSRGPHLRVDDLVVCASRRGTGIGREMLAGIAAEARRLELPKVLLDARHSARGFYERLGFVFREAEPCMIEVNALER